MAVGYDPGKTSASQFEDELSAISAQDQQALAEAEENERLYALEMEQQNNQERQQSRLSSAIRQKAGKVGKDVAIKLGKKYAKKLIARGAIYWLGIPAAILLGVLLLILVVVVMLNNACTSNSADGWFTSLASKAAYYSGVADYDICKELGFVVPSNTQRTAAVSTNATDENNSSSAEGDTTARTFLAGFGIPINKPCINPNGSVPNPPGQTCLEGVLQSTLEEVVRLQSACNQWAMRTNRPRELTPGPNRDEADSYCEVIVTGGTEQGHATSGTCVHGKGFKIDLSLRPNLNTFIQSNYDEIEPRGGDRRWYNNFTNTSYVRESDHWDISVGCA